MKNYGLSSISNETLFEHIYQIVTGIPTAFRDLCQIIPTVIDDVISESGNGSIKNSVFKELQEISPNLVKSLYLLSFEKYEGFSELEIK